MEHQLFVWVDLLGTFAFAFAVSGAVAAGGRRLDLFGVVFVSYVTACGGGVIRDLALGAVPPVGLSDWRYLATVVLAAGMGIWARPLVERLQHRSPSSMRWDWASLRWWGPTRHCSTATTPSWPSSWGW